MPNAATLPLLLGQLRLPSMARHWEDLLGQAGQRGWSAAEYLAALCEQELADRYGRRVARYATESRLPAGKSLATFDRPAPRFTELPGLPAGQVQALATTSDWVRQARNVLVFGPSGTGKTHLAAAIGHGLVGQGLRVRFTSTDALVQQLQLARAQLRLEDALQKLDKYRALVLDDFGYVRKDEQETHVLFELIARTTRAGAWSSPPTSPSASGTGSSRTR